MRCDSIWKNARLATMTDAEMGLIDDGVLAEAGGKILYAGPASQAPLFDADEEWDVDGRWITPGLIDCHTHIIHGGDRAHEFELRLQGADYEEIARAGGGILSTMRATRAASEEELIASALPRLHALMAEGVTTIEVKSGYGLEAESEIRMLRAARRLSDHADISVATSFLGAHALPPEYSVNPDAYIDLLIQNIMPQVAAEHLADAVDAFCENIGFTAQQTARLFKAARALNLPVKLHAEQLSNQHGAALAASFDALSADHLEHLDNDGIIAMAASGTVATLLPGAYYFMRETQLPPVAALRDAAIPIALATDCNPGTSPLTSLLLTMNMGATLFRLSVAECLLAVTKNAARALGRSDSIGTLEAGKRCDLAIWDIERPAELVYRMGFNPLHARIWSGQ
ncbi:imidazolonepropionase [Sphingopyxis yananensis]|uniref:imidazolonepropionase n=1 Tax=Sphingopyxis yananensis TaxID=2886687 RepID=UPI001D106C0C|nr:imidazolonepropionase [Sphingopyxis yananensis]MCC2603480.1 imidazolonepropionase [Sphingopyxis yananensis]